MKLARRLCVLGAVFAALTTWGAGSAIAAPGDFVGQVQFSQNCGSGLGVGVAYDGAGHLWVSCYGSNPDLLRTSATTGVVDQTYNIEGGVGALAYDGTRNALWAGPGCGASSQVKLIQLDATKSVVSSADAFVPALGGCLDDGIAYDAGDDSIYYSPDGSSTIAHHMTNGTLIGTFGFTGTGCYNSGLAIGGNLLFQGSDGCSHVWVIDKTSHAAAFDFSTIVPGDTNFRDEGLSCDTDTFAGIGKQVMWSKEAYSPNRAAAFEIPQNTCGVGGQPAGPPTCMLTATINGPPKQIQITVQATGGLASIVVTDSTNAATPVPPFTPGTTNPVVVTSTKINQAGGAHVALQVTADSGGTTLCDPVLPGTKAHAHPLKLVFQRVLGVLGQLGRLVRL